MTQPWICRFYWGNDFEGGEKEKVTTDMKAETPADCDGETSWHFTGWSYVFNKPTFGNVNAAFTHYSSTLKERLPRNRSQLRITGKVQPRTALTTSAYEPISISAPMLPTSCISALIIFITVFIPVDEKSYFSNGMTTQTRQNNDTALPAHELGIYMKKTGKWTKEYVWTPGFTSSDYTPLTENVHFLEPLFFQSFPDQSATQPQSLLYPDEPICTSSQWKLHQPAHRHMDTGQPQAWNRCRATNWL